MIIRPILLPVLHGRYGIERVTGYISEMAADTVAGRPGSHVELNGHAAPFLEALTMPKKT